MRSKSLHASFVLTLQRLRRPRPLSWIVLGLAGCGAGLGALALQAGPGAAPLVAMDPRVSGIDIELSFDPETGLIREDVDLRLEASELGSITFRINPGLTVERSATGEGFIEHRKAGTELHVSLDPPLSGSRTLRFHITGRPRRVAENLVQPERVVLGPDDHWYPTLDATWAAAQVTVRVPSGWTAIAPGALLQQGQGTWRWRSEQPLRGVAVAVAPELTIGEGRAIRVPVRLAAPDGRRRAGAVAQVLSGPMAWLSSSLVPYPFESFNLVLLPGLSHRVQASGMVVAPAAVLLDQPADGAALLAGQWFGQWLAGDGPWIEAFAAWEATVYSRDRGLGLPDEIARLRRQYFELPAARDVPLARADLRTPEAVLRGKGSAAPDMIRLTVGDRRFYGAVQDLFREPITPALSLQDIRSVFEKRAGATLLRSFSDWFDRGGAPEILATLRTMPTSDGAWRADLSLVQRRGVYALPVEVVFHGLGREHREVVDIDERKTSVYYLLPFEPRRVEIDPLGKLFRWKTE